MRIHQTPNMVCRTARLQCAAIVAAIVVFVLTGCAVGPDYQRPKIEAPQDFRFATTQPVVESMADLPWWEVFHDGDLQDLIRTALENNYDVRIAVTRVEQSRQLAEAARGQMFPSVGYRFGVARGQNEFLGQPSDAGIQTSTAAAGVINAAWEIDIWGRVRRLNESARAQFLATEEAKRGVMLSLVSEVAQAYLELLELDLQLDISQRATESFGRSLKLFTDRLEGGVANKLATSRAQAAVGSAAAQIPELQRQIAIKEDQLNVLVGRNPGPIVRHSTLLYESLPPDVPAGLPSSLLERRPDVRQAEQLLRSSNAQIGVAKANFFPQVGLTALLGKVSPDVSTITGGQANAWSIALGAAGPIFQGGTLLAQYRQAEAAWEQARLQYEQTTLNAFREVSDALISREKFGQSREQLSTSVTSYHDAVDIALQRFMLGKSSYYEVLEAQQLLYPAESSLAQSELNQRLATVQLYKALGGGWQLSDERWNAGPTTAPATNPVTVPASQRSESQQ
ncbi:MAG TPA: efflux transporter outer membrane subunit [Tepidisphaeraceae bacterium]|jgi:multidrug efflux system outer membrane protein|nr:efflux transporter outer membrane subunit [Tepidisphaeraceae bacterium]